MAPTNRAWLKDPAGLLTQMLPLVMTLEDAASFVRYFGERGQVLTNGTTGLILGTNEIAALFSFVLEERAGRDLLEHYRWFGATPGEYGRMIEDSAFALPVDHRGWDGWTERLHAVGLAVVNRRDAERLSAATWSIELSTEDI